jgi:hypothetical protein
MGSTLADRSETCSGPGPGPSPSNCIRTIPVLALRRAQAIGSAGPPASRHVPASRVSVSHPQAKQLAAGINLNDVGVVVGQARFQVFRRQMFHPSGEIILGEGDVVDAGMVGEFMAKPGVPGGVVGLRCSRRSPFRPRTGSSLLPRPVGRRVGPARVCTARPPPCLRALNRPIVADRRMSARAEPITSTSCRPRGPLRWP